MLRWRVSCCQLPTGEALSKPTDLVQGTLDLLILKVIALEADAWMGHRQTHPPDVRRRSPGGPGRPLPVSSQTRAERLDHRGMGRQREQTAGEVLHADQSRP